MLQARASLGELHLFRSSGRRRRKGWILSLFWRARMLHRKPVAKKGMIVSPTLQQHLFKDCVRIYLFSIAVLRIRVISFMWRKAVARRRGHSI
jgi:hypothetical protein